MTKSTRNAGLRSDGELVQAATDTFDFIATPKDTAGLLLPAVLAAAENAVTDPAEDVRPSIACVSHGEDNLPNATGDEDHRKWTDLLSMSGGATEAGYGDDGMPAGTVVWDLG